MVQYNRTQNGYIFKEDRHTIKHAWESIDLKFMGKANI